MKQVNLEVIKVSFPLQNPPAIVKFVMESICVMLALKPERKPDPSTGKMMEDFWAPSQKLLGDMKFLDRLKAYDKDNIAPAIMKKIRERYIIFHHSDFSSSRFGAESYYSLFTISQCISIAEL